MHFTTLFFTSFAKTNIYTGLATGLNQFKLCHQYIDIKLVINLEKST